MIDIDDRLTSFETNQIVREGRGNMPGFESLEGYERSAMVGFIRIRTRKTRI
ncbi:MAG: hypothetical protein CM1200mP40_00900 [Gammaproteobacteria bacterium]|nr:MAG: hypothetical protein CM1200mP40_00900 [Gammaproteobacteria bacterium]